MKFNWFHLMPYRYLPDDFKEAYPSVWVDIPSSLFEPEKRPLAVQRLPRRTGVRGPDGLRRHLRERTPPERLRPDAVAQPDGRGHDPAHLARRDLRDGQQHRALQPAGARGRRVRHARRHERRAADRRLSGRHGHGIPTSATARPRPRCATNTPRRTTSSCGRGPSPNPSPSTANTPNCATSTCGRGPSSSRTRRSGFRAADRWRTWDFCADNDYNYSYLSYFGYKRAAQVMKGYWDKLDEKGKDVNPYRGGFAQVVAVAETDALAEKEYGPHLDYFFNRCLPRARPLCRRPRLPHAEDGRGRAQGAGRFVRRHAARRPDVEGPGRSRLHHRRLAGHGARAVTRGDQGYARRPAHDPATLRQHPA